MTRAHERKRVEPPAGCLLGCPQLRPTGERGCVEDDRTGVPSLDRRLGTRSRDDDGGARGQHARNAMSRGRLEDGGVRKVSRDLLGGARRTHARTAQLAPRTLGASPRGGFTVTPPAGQAPTRIHGQWTGAMRTAGQVIAAPTHDSRPVAGSCDLDEDRTGAQALAEHAQGSLRDTHVPACALTVCLRLPVQVYARCCCAQSIGRGIEAHRPSGAHESLGFHRARVRCNEQARSFNRAALDRDIERVAPGEASLAQAVIPVVENNNQAEGGSGHPHGRARPHDEGDTPQRRGDVHAVALLRGDLATAECCTDTKILLKFSCNTSGMLTGGRHDDDSASRGHGRGHGVRQARAQIRAQRRDDGARRFPDAQTGQERRPSGVGTPPLPQRLADDRGPRGGLRRQFILFRARVPGRQRE